jgi:hypothetical protein
MYISEGENEGDAPSVTDSEIIAHLEDTVTSQPIVGLRNSFLGTGR